MLQRQRETIPSVVQPTATPDAATGQLAPLDFRFHLPVGADSTPRLQAAALTQASGGQLTRAGDSLRQLQQGYGNRHVQQVMDHARSASAPGPVIQPKLVLGPVDDPYERQADRVAAQITGGAALPAPRLGGERLMRKTTGTPAQDPARGPVDPGVQQAIQSAHGGGRPLADTVRTPLEQALGADFSGVRVHTDARADQLNQSLQARAFTTGRDIFFRRGHFAPVSASGQSLLAHELTHTVQQGAVPPVTESTPSDEHPAYTFGGRQTLYLKPALAGTIQRAKFKGKKDAINNSKSPFYAELVTVVLKTLRLDKLDDVAEHIVLERLKDKKREYKSYARFADEVAKEYKGQKASAASPVERKPSTSPVEPTSATEETTSTESTPDVDDIPMAPPMDAPAPATIGGSAAPIQQGTSQLPPEQELPLIIKKIKLQGSFNRLPWPPAQLVRKLGKESIASGFEWKGTALQDLIGKTFPDDKQFQNLKNVMTNVKTDTELIKREATYRDLSRRFSYLSTTTEEKLRTIKTNVNSYYEQKMAGKAPKAIAKQISTDLNKHIRIGRRYSDYESGHDMQERRAFGVSYDLEATPYVVHAHIGGKGTRLDALSIKDKNNEYGRSVVPNGVLDTVLRKDSITNSAVTLRDDLWKAMNKTTDEKPREIAFRREASAASGVWSTVNSKPGELDNWNGSNRTWDGRPYSAQRFP